MSPTRRMRPPALSALALAALALGTADQACGQRLFLTPSLTLSTEYDDNVDSSSESRRGDALAVARPGLRFELLEEPWTVGLGLSTRAEKFLDRDELDNAGKQWDANFSLQVRPTPSWLVSLGAAAVKSTDAGTADTLTGITQGRFSTLSVSVTGSASYQIDQRTTVAGQAAYRLLESDSPQSRGSETREAGASLSRQIDARNSGVLRYSFTQFVFDDTETTGTTQTLATDTGRSQNSHGLSLGLVHIWSPTLTISWANGVTYLERRDGTQDITWNSSQRYDQQFRDFTFSAAYDRNAGVAGVVGGAGVNQTISLTGTWSATRELTLSVDGRITDVETRGEAVDTHLRTYAGTLRLVYRILSWLAFEASFRHQTQDDRVGSNDVKRNVLSIGLTASDRLRLY